MIDITTKANGRKLNIAVTFAGDVCGLFWLNADAHIFAKSASKNTRNCEYAVVDPDASEAVIYVNGKVVG